MSVRATSAPKLRNAVWLLRGLALLNSSVFWGVYPNVMFVADSGNHALRRVSREMPSRLRLSVKAVDTNVYPGGGGESGYARDRILDEYGYYSVNGPPNNETTHAHGVITYIDESHELTMCVYPSSEYFLLFKGSVQVVVSDPVVGGHTYFVWTGQAAGDERSENFRLRGGGCTRDAARA